MNVLFVIFTLLLGQVQASEEQSCESDCSSLDNAASGEILLQAKSERSATVSKKTTMPARQVLPEHLLKLGIATFGDEAKLNQVVADSPTINIKYGGVDVLLRILAKDTAEKRLGAQTEDGQDYGLDTLLEVKADVNEPKKKKEGDMMNVIDMGANYGPVVISVFKKYKDKVRAVVVEPIGATYFFLRWNLYLNGVPDLSKEDFTKDTKKPGVVALHGAITDKMGQDLQMCSHPEWSMNARTSIREAEWPCDCNVMSCTMVPSVTTEDLLESYFAKEDISLLKMDCEGCEYQSLPAINKHSSKILRLVGELHLPEENLIDIACKYDAGKYMSKVCRMGEAEWSCCLPLDCSNKKRNKCKW